MPVRPVALLVKLPPLLLVTLPVVPPLVKVPELVTAPVVAP